jgi:hypothetical protein
LRLLCRTLHIVRYTNETMQRGSGANLLWTHCTGKGLPRRTAVKNFTPLARKFEAPITRRGGRQTTAMRKV